MSVRKNTCVAVLAFLGPVLLACASPSGPQQRIEAMVHDRFAQLASSDPAAEYRVGPIRVDAAGEDLYQARFEFDRLHTDEAAMPHIARREQTWLVRELADGTTEILQVDEQKVIAFPGTGPQIVCY